ncbi:hypothetical protein D9758_002251 [Tetrapyrgos nigripes]|uniref:Arrestin C-terminal-like domain-containing protein n=1 Tax=Tetrapyrgos nigripes TaxID=182062 RepID=A0A8H5GNY7_9AGAR|nr:hypothetical protein D9758_002251 [Tetrapyrgos nigripes]
MSQVDVNKSPSKTSSTLRSDSSMRGLLQAETGGSMVQRDVCDAISGYREGSSILPETMSPCARNEVTRQWSVIVAEEQSSLARHGTLLTANAPPGRNAAELKSILGNSNARLKSGATVLSGPPVGCGTVEATTLEQAKLRARVEVDIVPESNVLVQGGFLNGVVKIRIRSRSRRESAILISSGKLRVIGFESIQNEDHRYTFFQQSALLTDVTKAFDQIFVSPADQEGFREPREGVHVLPFSMLLPLQAETGAPKGVISPHGGVALRYIAMFSIKVKERETNRRSIAHFYRDCEVWPRLNPASVLAPTPRPITTSVSRSLLRGGSGKVTLVASLHRLNWIAGQFCYVKVKVTNHSKKLIKSLTLGLVRSTVVFKPKRHLEMDGAQANHDADACQTSTMQKQVAETTLEMGEGVARGHASGKGWWTGVHASETTSFSHFLPIPANALSVTRERLLEVEYSIRVSISAGPLSSDIHVSLPINIINFLSVDPPPTHPDESPEELLRGALECEASSSQSSKALDTLLEGDDDEESQENEVLHCPRTAALPEDHTSSDLGNFANHDDNDALVQHAISSVLIDSKYAEHGSRFADLYYSSIHDNLAAEAEQPESHEGMEEETTPQLPGGESLLRSPHSSHSSIADIADLPPLRRPREPNAFVKRVQKKLEEAKKADRQNPRQHSGQATASGTEEDAAGDGQESFHSSQEDTRNPSNTGSSASRNPSRPRSCTTGSYFRPRDEMPAELEQHDDTLDDDDDDALQQRNDDLPTTYSTLAQQGSILSSSTTMPGSSKPKRLPITTTTHTCASTGANADLPQSFNVNSLVNSFPAKAGPSQSSTNNYDGGVHASLDKVESQVPCPAETGIGIAQFHYVPPRQTQAQAPASSDKIVPLIGDDSIQNHSVLEAQSASQTRVGQGGRVRSHTVTASTPQTSSSTAAPRATASLSPSPHSYPHTQTRHYEEYPNRIPSKDPGVPVTTTSAAPTIPAAKSVKDKIRELEERSKVEMNSNGFGPGSTGPL